MTFLNLTSKQFPKTLKKLFFFILFCLCFTKISFAQELVGDFLSKHYSVKEYGTHPRNFDVSQTKEGIMYFGNAYGLLEFDGQKWTNYSLPNGKSALKIYTDSSNYIFVGSYNEFGYFDQQMKYQSLLPIADSTNHHFGEITNIIAHNSNIFFISRNVIFKYDGKRAQKIETNSLKNLDFAPSTGELIQNFNIQLPKGTQISDQLQINKDELLITSNNKGIFIYHLRKKSLLHLSIENGLHSNQIHKAFLDINKDVWLATDNGITFIELNSPIQFRGKNAGITGMGYAAIYFLGATYYGTSSGVFVQSNTNSSESTPQLIQNSEGQIWSFFISNNELFYTSTKGVHKIKDKQSFLLESNFSDEGHWKMEQLKSSKDFILKGTFEGFQFYTTKNGQLSFSHKINGFKESSRVFTQDAQGNIWMCHGNKGLYKLRLSKDLQSFSQIEKINNSIGLKDNEITHVTNIKGEIIISSAFGLYKVDTSTNKIVKYKELNLALGGERYINKIVGIHNNLWVFSGNDLLLITTDNNKKHRLIEQPLKKISSSFVGSYEFITSLDSTKFIVGSQSGFIAVELSKLVTKAAPLNTLIRNFSFEYFTDSLIAFNPSMNYTFPYEQNSIIIHFTSTSYELQNIVKYQFSISKDNSSQKKWSNWNQSPQAQLLDLSEGTYLFSVRAINIYGNRSPHADFKFTILAPWYRTSFAYSIYLVFFFLVIFGVIKIFIFKAKKNQLRLFRNERIQHKQDLLEKEKAIIVLENSKLEAEMTIKNNELAHLASSLTQKSYLLTQLRNKASNINPNVPQAEQQLIINNLISTIDTELDFKNEWVNFQIHFDQLHNNFLHKLRSNHPKLNDTWLLFCAYIRLNKSNKEISELMNISISAVEKRKARLGEKLNLGEKEKFKNYLFSSHYQ